MISIVIPTHKGSNKVLLSIYSALNQTYSDIEIIVVDDNGIGSDEQLKTASVLKNLIEEKKIKYITHEVNRNGSAARNTGFRASVGEYINFLDDDDVLLPDKISVQKKCLDESDECIGAAVCGTYFVHENGKGYVSIPDCNSNHIQKDYLCERVKFNTSAILFKRGAIEEIGGFDESFSRHQDWEFCMRMMAKYRFKTCEKLLLIKYATARNIASNPEKAVKYFDHFCRKMTPFLNALDDGDKTAILNYHTRRLYKTYILSKDILGACRYAGKIGMSLSQVMIAFKELCGLVWRKKVKGNTQLVKSYQEYMDEAMAALG